MRRKYLYCKSITCHLFRRGGTTLGGKIQIRDKIVIGALVLLLAGGAAWRTLDHSTSSPELTGAGFAPVHGAAEEEEPEPVMITVHLVGAVKFPGVYQLPEGSRVYELIELGGGFSEETDGSTLNQARPLMDGEQVFVSPAADSVPNSNSGGSGATETRININRATASELTALPGIGEVRAGQIVDYREANGFFTDPAQIMDVSGIGETTFNNIAHLITIY